MAGKNSMLAFVIFLLIKNNWDNGVMKYYVKRKIWGSDVFIVSIKKNQYCYNKKLQASYKILATQIAFSYNIEEKHPKYW